MGFFSFIKDTGSKLFGTEDSAEQKAQKVKEHLSQYNFDLSSVNLNVDGDTVTLSGKAKNIDEKQRILATAGNVEGITHVKDDLTLTEPLKIEIPDIQKTMYTVKSGDTLSKISKEVYGDANQYNKIFEANRPMLSDPDKIYPGQVLYIPQA
ncbi:peptidoglycan-binding protein LysM [Candidatus Ornithobacterium hominis]|uniref:peptidoglycan-binding protein LysM n=1 Tax=Candidatus Ornithobacterium hominis TaxID=2497989 RepID=UPI0024BCCC23|nr:peptidoglycan-binding protein LysM [Candidatus Ornithobacterium hominis]CAI9428691.1 peptidoglycan-binding protein LysM [Candidatus Ornithobacterium hominis]